MPIERIPLKSRRISAIGYDPISRTLEIVYKNTLFRYYNVGNHIYDALLHAPDHEEFYDRNIKGHYACMRCKGRA